MARRHNDLNILALGARITPDEAAFAFVRAFLETPFDGGRHQRRVDKIAALESMPRGSFGGPPACSGCGEPVEPRNPKSDA